MVTNSILTLLAKSTGKEKKPTTTLLRVMSSLSTGAVLDVTEVLPADQQPQHQQQCHSGALLGIWSFCKQFLSTAHHKHNTTTESQDKFLSVSTLPWKETVIFELSRKALKGKTKQNPSRFCIWSDTQFAKWEEKTTLSSCTRVQSCDSTFTSVKKGSFSMTKLYLEMTVLGYCIPSIKLQTVGCYLQKKAHCFSTALFSGWFANSRP